MSNKIITGYDKASNEPEDVLEINVASATPGDIFIYDGSKLIPEEPKTSLISNSMRFYCYTDRRWVTESDDNYGTSYFQGQESGGAGADPLVEWEHMGTVIPKGKILKKMHLIARANSTQVTDFEISIMMRVPNPITRYESGFDSDTEMTNTEIFRGNFVQPNFTGFMTDRRYLEIDLGNYEAAEVSQLSIYIKPIGTLFSTRYIMSNYTIEVM